MCGMVNEECGVVVMVGGGGSQGPEAREGDRCVERRRSGSLKHPRANNEMR